VAGLLVAAGTFEQIVAYFFFVSMLFLALSVTATFRLRREGRPPSGYETPGYPVTPMLFIGGIAAVLVLLAARNPLQSMLGVGVVALGIPLYSAVRGARTTIRLPEE
jgi:APA family basic amino acid/polyamine antiporter